MPVPLPTFDLVVATVDRVEELGRLLDSLEGQSHRGFRLIVVDQNSDERLGEVFGDRPLDVLRLKSARGLSRARNTALEHVRADVVAFPDDDCVYSPDLLERVARRLAQEPGLGGITGRAVDSLGRSAPSWKMDRTDLTDENLWNRANSFTIFLRREVISRVGRFDEQLGLGSGAPWHAAEEADYLVRAVRTGARIEYDSELTVIHDRPPVAPTGYARGYRDGAGVGYILGKHRYPARVIGRMLVRPGTGALLSLLRGDLGQARYRAATFKGRIAGLRGSRTSR